MPPFFPIPPNAGPVPAWLIVVAIVLLVIGQARGADFNFGPVAGPVEALVLGVADGDTIRIEANTWPGQKAYGSIRVRGVDTPEIRGKCDAEKAKALAGRRFTCEMLGGTMTGNNCRVPPLAKVGLREIDFDKYGGRYLAHVEIGGRDLAEALIARGLARPYDGGAREGWCGG